MEHAVIETEKLFQAHFEEWWLCLSSLPLFLGLWGGGGLRRSLRKKECIYCKFFQPAEEY